MTSSMVAMDAPMSSSLGAMGPLLRKLVLLTGTNHHGLPPPLKLRIGLLKEDLEDISADLLEQSMADFPSTMAKYWMDEVRGLSYEIEDCVDKMTSSHTGARRSAGGHRIRRARSVGGHRIRRARSVGGHRIRRVRTVGGDRVRRLKSVDGNRVRRVKIARLPKRVKPCTRISKIARFRTLVWEASQRHERYQLDGCTSIPSYGFSHQPWVPTPQQGLAANYLVGVDEAKTKLTDWITNKADDQLNVVTIVGPAGVGKTTLAKELYSDLGRHFECWAFAQVSRKPDMIKLLQSLLSQVREHQHHSDACTVQNVIDGLREHLQGKRYFIVIDDLWETSAWDIIFSAFPEGDNCSRIIATVENVDVALECCGYQLDHIVRVKPLGHQDSEKLLFNRVFGSELQCPDELMEVSHGIIRICGGLPLAIIGTASLLSRQRDNSELWHQIHKYLCFIWNINPTLEEIQKGILNLIYISLPLHLKTCLLHLSVYPEGYTIWKVDLVKQWISEGFISAAEEKDTDEVAESYFYELVRMGMIQPMQINYNGEVLSCTVHHIVLDLITHKSKEEKFITLIDQSQTITVTKAYRLSLHFSKSQYAKQQEVRTLSHVRSLAFFGFHKCMPSILEFKLLRVLILEFWGDPHGCMSLNLSGISQLLQLRYFKIACNITVELPGQMQGLRYLETLEINARISALPLDIVQLPSLLHLCLREEKNLPDGVGCIKSLRTLQYFNLSSNSEDSIWSLGKLTNLQNLHLTCSAPPCDEHLKRNLLALAYSLGKLGNLKSLTLAPGTSGSAVLFDGSSIISFPPIFLQRLELLPPICVFFRLPEWIGHLHKLSSLKVVVRELLMKDVDMLAELSGLTVLSLYVRQPTAEFIIFNRAAFPVLKCFKFWCGVLCLAFQEKALSNLERLKVGFNAHSEEQFGHIIAGVEHLLNLRVIDGHIGAAAGAQESDRKAAEAALKYSISNHSMSPILNIQMIDCVDEEYEPFPPLIQIRIPNVIDLPSSSSQTLMPDGESCISSLTNLRKPIVRRCQKPGCWEETAGRTIFCKAHDGDRRCKFPECTRGAVGPNYCRAHGEGRRCHKPGCAKGAAGRTIFCKAHGGGRRCEHLGCTRSAEGRTDYCMGHGGGRRCSHEGCSRGARGKSGLCKAHGGGKRCMQKDCTKSAGSGSGLCISHGGGRRCEFAAGCSRGARGKSGLCKAHGGGKRCMQKDCTKSAESGSGLCISHGGGRRCEFAAGCSRGAVGSTLFCKAHGGGKRCLFGGGGVCAKRVRGGTQFCVGHGGGKRCAVSGCTRSARGQTDYCVAHGSSKRRKFDLHSSSDSVAISGVDYQTPTDKVPEIVETEQGREDNSEEVLTLQI